MSVLSWSDSLFLSHARRILSSALALQDTDKDDQEFAIVFAAMGVNMETAHFFKQVRWIAAAP